MTAGLAASRGALAGAARGALVGAARRALAGAARGALAGAVAVAAGALVLVACGSRRADDRAASGDRAPSKGAAEVREAAAARYVPPATGRLTEAQVRMFLGVRERECRLREGAAVEAQRRREAVPAEVDAARETPADLRAAQELHVDPQEYRWVRDRVLEAEGAATAQALYQKMIAGRELLLAHRRKELEAMTDPGERAAGQRDIEDWRRGLEASEPAVPAALRANVALLARFREPLGRLRAVEERALATAAGMDTGAGLDKSTGTGAGR